MENQRLQQQQHNCNTQHTWQKHSIDVIDLLLVSECSNAYVLLNGFDFILFCVLCVVACVHKLMQNVVWCIYTFFKQSVLPIYYCLDIYHTALVSFAFDLFRRRYFFLSRARSMAKCLGFVFIIRSPQLMSVPQCVYGM